MKILLVAPRSVFWDQVEQALSARCSVRRFDTRRAVILGPLLEGRRQWWSKVRRIPGVRQLNSLLVARRLLREVEHWTPDAVLLYKLTDLAPSVLEQLRRRKVLIAAWQIDAPTLPDVMAAMERSRNLLDVIFHFDGDFVRAGGDGPQLVHLPLAVDPDRFAPMRQEAQQQAYETDIAFVGAAYPERVRLLQQIAGRRLALYGWEDWKQTPLAASYRGPLSADDAARVYAYSKICININWIPPIGGVNLRTFEIPAAGGFLLTDFRSDLPVLFQEGEEVAVFRNDREFVELVERYLSDDAARERMRRAGIERVLHDHTLDQRVRVITETLSGMLP